MNTEVVAGVQETREAALLTNARPRVLCVAPAWNEGERIARVVRAVPRDLVETTVVVDDGSTDDTADHALSGGATVIRSASNRGVGAAIRSGIDYAQGFSGLFSFSRLVSRDRTPQSRRYLKHRVLPPHSALCWS